MSEPTPLARDEIPPCDEYPADSWFNCIDNPVVYNYFCVPCRTRLALDALTAKLAERRTHDPKGDPPCLITPPLHRHPEHDHGATTWSPGACELCWGQAFNRMFLLGGSQVDHYRRLLDENEGKPGHV